MCLTVPEVLRQMPDSAPALEKLTPRETDVPDQPAKGFRFKEIVDNLGISSVTCTAIFAMYIINFMFTPAPGPW